MASLLIDSDPSDGNEPDSAGSVGEDGRPEFRADVAGSCEPGFAGVGRLDFESVFIVPQGLRPLEVNPVLGLIGLAFGGIELDEGYSESK